MRSGFMRCVRVHHKICDVFGTLPLCSCLRFYQIAERFLRQTENFWILLDLQRNIWSSSRIIRIAIARERKFFYEFEYVLLSMSGNRWLYRLYTHRCMWKESRNCKFTGFAGICDKRAVRRADKAACSRSVDSGRGQFLGHRKSVCDHYQCKF